MNRKNQQAADWMQARSSGLLMHVTSLPDGHGIGDLGPAARAWVETLSKAKQTWWQVLPLNPPGDGASPYQALSAFAGNPLLISIDDLVEDGLLKEADVPSASFSGETVEFKKVAAFKMPLLYEVFDRFGNGAGRRLSAAFDQFRHEQREWLDDFALFMALREMQTGRHWTAWSRDLVMRNPAALRSARHEMESEIVRQQFLQFLFFRQLDQLRRFALKRGVRLIGDMPIFVSGDSADVWANPHLFLLDKNRQPKVIAGVPPDYFSATGQRWGNPLYDWKAMQKDDFNWWVSRAKAALAQADVVRIDHFRGFEASWHIPASAPTAQHGRWVKSPGADLFDTMREQLGGLPFIAEDLGLITDEVRQLRDQFDLPGMRVTQFAFDGDPQNLFLPHNHTHNSVAYTGTHDNDTTVGWYRSLRKKDRQLVQKYLPDLDADPAQAMLRLTWSSVARIAIAPVQDLLGLDSRHRMNRPGTATGNWAWRMPGQSVAARDVERLASTTAMFARARS